MTIYYMYSTEQEKPMSSRSNSYDTMDLKVVVKFKKYRLRAAMFAWGTAGVAALFPHVTYAPTMYTLMVVGLALAATALVHFLRAMQMREYSEIYNKSPLWEVPDDREADKTLDEGKMKD